MAAATQTQPVKVSIKDDLKVLRNDASKVISDITSLTQKLGNASKEKSGEFVDEASARLETELASLKERVSAMSGDLQKYAGVAGKHVKSHPYLYVAATIGAGFLIGKALMNRKAID